MLIQRLTSQDYEAFMALRTLGLTHEPECFRVSAQDDHQLGEDFWRKRLDTDIVLGVRVENKLVGIGGLTRLVGEKLAHKGLIWGMYISPEARGGQTSALLMGALIENARGYVRQLQLTLMAANKRAMAYYERHGFTTYAIEPASVMTTEGPADEALMWRLVDAT